MTEYTEFDEALEALWRERFGEPPPIKGCPELTMALLGVTPIPDRSDRPN